MEEKDSAEPQSNNLCRCPHCPCCFCNITDLQRHMDAYGPSKEEHMAEFKRTHGRLEHGSFSSPE